MNDYNKLTGGNLTNVYKKDNTIIRSQGPYSTTIHRLLLHLETVGFDACPRFIGIDQNNNEILSFVEGNSLSNYPKGVDKKIHLEGIRRLALLMHSFHNATSRFVTTKDDIWMLSYQGNLKKEVICHNDIAPYNVTFVDNLPYGLIDFDTCCPAPRIWDIVYALYRFIPMTDDTIHNEYKKLCCEIFFKHYGIKQPEDLFLIMMERLQYLADTILNKAIQGNVAFQKMLEEGHRDLYIKEISYIEEHMHLWK